MKLRIVSENNFPTAAGLASSAAGFAALVYAIALLYCLPASPADLSRIARQGSGSACRSLFGGYVGWKVGSKADGSDSVAYEVAPASHWPEMRALILVASDAKKDVSSTAGMQQTVETSALFQHRIKHVVPMRMLAMEQAIEEKDFYTFANHTMHDSNSFHATCLDTFPPITYLNDTSRAAIRMCDRINESAGNIVCAYTFDAGPNAVIYYLERDNDAVAGVFKSILGNLVGWDSKQVQESAVPAGSEVFIELLKRGVSRVIMTGVGEGPQKVQEHLSGS